MIFKKWENHKIGKHKKVGQRTDSNFPLVTRVRN